MAKSKASFKGEADKQRNAKVTSKAVKAGKIAEKDGIKPKKK